MSEEKPLDVEVGEALGWTDLRAVGSDMIPGHRDYYYGRAPGNLMIGEQGRNDQLPWYSTDWSATGPLIERFRIELEWMASPQIIAWTFLFDDCGHRGDGATPLEAVCRLIIALKEAGKL